MSESPTCLRTIAISGSEKAVSTHVGIEKRVVFDSNPNLNFVFNGQMIHSRPIMMRGCRATTEGGVWIGFTYRF